MEYENLLNYDFLVSEDDNSKDVICVRDTVSEPKFCQTKDAEGKLLNIIVVPFNLGIWDSVRGGRETFQPISMIIVTNSKAFTSQGKQMLKKLTEDMTPEEIAYHYLGISKEFLDGDIWGKSYKRLSEQENISDIKKVIPLYRVACDLFPKAMYMLLKQDFCNGISINEMINIANNRDDYNMTLEIIKNQDTNVEELDKLYESIRKKLESIYRKEYGDCAKLNLKIMGQDIN